MFPLSISSLLATRIVLAAVLALALSACGGGGASEVGVDPLPVVILASDAKLSALSLSAGAISPGFDSDTESYQLFVKNTVSSTTLTAMLAEDTASATLQGAALVSGVATAAIALQPGDNTLTVLVTAEDGVSQQAYTVVVHRAPPSFEISDPTAAAGNEFGKHVSILPNGNIVFVVSKDSSVASNNGAVHLFNPYSQTLVASFYGDGADDQFGANIFDNAPVSVLPNGNFVIAASSDTVDGVVNAGQVLLVNGTTGAVIGTPIKGATTADQVGISGVAVLSNGNYVIPSPYQDVAGKSDAGSLILVNGETGAQIGNAITGNDSFDLFGLGGVLTLANGNFVAAAYQDDVDGVVDAGSLALFDGSTAEQIGATLAGDNANDQISSGGIRELPSGNFLVLSKFDDVSGVSDAGSVMLINGASGALINTIAGNDSGDALSSEGITILANQNFVISSSADDNGGLSDVGSVMLVNGATGVVIDTLYGEDANDQYGNEKPLALKNGNYVVPASLDVVGGNSLAGSVRLLNGETGALIGAVTEGDRNSDSIGLGGAVELSNGNYVVGSAAEDQSPFNNEGSVRLFDGSTGAQLNQINGLANNDQVGNQGIAALANGNYVIVSDQEDAPGPISDAGSVRIMDGSNGNLIGSTIYGEDADDRLGYDSGAPIVLSNGNVVVVSRDDNNGGITGAGSMLLIDGSSASVIDKIFGASSGDFTVTPFADDFLIESPLQDYFLLNLKLYDNSAGADSGRVLLFTQ